MFDITEDDITIIRGSSALINAMNSEKPTKFTIFANRTMRNYVSEYENIFDAGNFKYPVIPKDLLARLGITTLLIDEAHQEFFAIHKIVMNIDPTNLIGLSATFNHSDYRVNRMYETMFPKGSMLDFIPIKKYTELISISYRFKMPVRMRQSSYGYSQNSFESMIKKSIRISSNYLNMLYIICEDYYIKEYEVGDKLVIFIYRTDLCLDTANFFKVKYPKLKIMRYISGDDYEEMMDSDIIITTTGSLGTAKDLPKLMTVINTVSFGSRQLNIQTFGRLREISGRTTRYIYTYGEEIAGHRKHHQKRIDILGPRARNHKFIFHNIPI